MDAVPASSSEARRPGARAGHGSRNRVPVINCICGTYDAEPPVAQPHQRPGTARKSPGANAPEYPALRAYKSVISTIKTLHCTRAPHLFSISPLGTFVLAEVWNLAVSADGLRIY